MTEEEKASIAREYCKAHGIRLYISPLDAKSGLYLLADLTGKGDLLPVAKVENNEFDFESGYALFWEATHGYIH